MKRLLLLLFLSGIAYNSILAKEDNWSVSLIPAELLVKANAVLRNSEITLTIKENGEAENLVKYAITVLNENGLNYSYLVEGYDKFSSISGLEGVVFDKNGKKIKKIKMDEFLDVSAMAGFSIYDDNRVKIANPKVGDYPFTIVYEYKRKQKSFFVYPGWQVYLGYNISVQKSSFILNIEKNSTQKINYKGNENFNLSPVETNLADVKTLTWNVENQKAIEEEPVSVDFSEITPVLRIAPEKFVMDDYEGSNKSWSDLGYWAYQLGKGKLELPEESKEKIKLLISNQTSDFDKAKSLYEYVQNKVRYVSIQVGIGGFQPFPAETVERLSYGDCKALTNYMKSILDVVGIKSYYCLVRAGEDAAAIDNKFVTSQFNHAFLMLPIDKDTLYLECTSQELPFGYNGTFTDDREVLVLDSTQSYLKRSKIYSKDENKTINSFSFIIEQGMSASVTQKSSYIGVASEDIRYLKRARAEKQRENIMRRFQLRQVKITNLNYSEIKNIIPVINENVEFIVPQIAQVTNNNTVLLPFNQVTQLQDLKRVSNRKSDVLIRRDEIQVDTIKYQFPKNIKIEKVPIVNSFSSEFGNYQLNISINNNSIVFTRILEWKKGRFEPELYPNLVQFQRKINEMDRQMIVLKL